MLQMLNFILERLKKQIKVTLSLNLAYYCTRQTLCIHISLVIIMVSCLDFHSLNVERVLSEWASAIGIQMINIITNIVM